MACAGDTPTLETLAAVELLRREDPELKIRVVNVVDLMTLQPAEEHPHGLTDRAFDELFTADKPIIFAYHGYPWLIHRLTYRRTNHDNIHVRGYKEKGTTTTPFDMAVQNDLDRFHLFADAVQRIPKLESRAAYVKQFVRDKLVDHQRYITTYGEDCRRSGSGFGLSEACVTPSHRARIWAAFGRPGDSFVWIWIKSSLTVATRPFTERIGGSSGARAPSVWYSPLTVRPEGTGSAGVNDSTRFS